MKTLLKKGLGLFLVMAIMVSITIPAVAEDNTTIMDPNFVTIEENPSGHTIEKNGTPDIHDNAVITDNNGTVVFNNGTIKENNGTVTMNFETGMITDNKTGTVDINGGSIENNHGTVDKNGANLQEAKKALSLTTLASSMKTMVQLRRIL